MALFLLHFENQQEISKNCIFEQISNVLDKIWKITSLVMYFIHVFEALAFKFNLWGNPVDAIFLFVNDTSHWNKHIEWCENVF